MAGVCGYGVTVKVMGRMRLNAGTVLLVATKLNEPDIAPIGTFRLKVLEVAAVPSTTGATG
jgi:hypothetical protein